MDTTLRQISRQTEEAAARNLAEGLNLSYEVLDGFPFGFESLKLIPLEQTKERQVATYLHTATRLRVAIVNPQDQVVVAQLQQFSEGLGAQLELTVVSQSSFNHLVKQYLVLLHEQEDVDKRVADQHLHTEQDYFQSVTNLEEMQRSVKDANTSTLLDVILAGAVNQGASDIHFEPGEQQLLVRFRIDGLLRPVLTIPVTKYPGIVSRVKVLAELKLDQQTKGQDGRFSLGDRGVQADVRVATIPTSYGEGIVMRLLRHNAALFSLDQLGFSEQNKQYIASAIKKPYGMILVTGPTGSGKTTTLYALLQSLNTPERKIITLEDPVEYRLPGIEQSQVNVESGYTFAEGLKDILRQDPDVVMIGEIRDQATATAALNASLTGHLVLATLHSNDAITAPLRLLEMGVQSFLLSGSIRLVISQRLVRRIDPATQQLQGRLVVSEVLAPNRAFERAITGRQDSSTLAELALGCGMIPIAQDGEEKLRLGMTSEQEISRIAS